MTSRTVPSDALLPADLEHRVALVDDVAGPDQNPPDRAGLGGLDRDGGVGDDGALDGDGVGDGAAGDGDDRGGQVDRRRPTRHRRRLAGAAAEGEHHQGEGDDGPHQQTQCREDDGADRVHGAAHGSSGRGGALRHR
jgi:hypothetical protein